LIDLHTHTTASDGRCTPSELVRRASAAGVTVLSVTDHDTTAACETAARACAEVGIEFVHGIEMTAATDGADVHVLGYFIDQSNAGLVSFLADQRLRRVSRIRTMIERLAAHGIHLDADAVLRPGLEDNTKTVGRPWIARALVAAGHVGTTTEAFDRWLARGRPAFVPRVGAPPDEVIRRIHDAGGIASLAHPGLLQEDELIEGMVAGGLDALEAYHTDHDQAATARYVKLAARFGLAVSGGSDYHADQSHGGAAIGSVDVPREDYDALKARAGFRATSRATASGPNVSS